MERPNMSLPAVSWPTPNEDKTTTLDPESVAKFKLTLTMLRVYIEQQLEACAVDGPATP
jgi:hypothetical protein